MGYDWDVKNQDEKSVVTMIGFNRVGGLTRCLMSFIKQLGDRDGILIIDNKATDRVKKEIKNLRKEYPIVKVIENINSNIASARNLAISYAKNNGFKYCLFLDDDCMAEKSWLLNMVYTAMSTDNAAVVVGNVKYFPKESIYSIIEEKLWKGWIEAGKFEVRISDIDTKNCLLNIPRLGGVLFEEGENKNGRRADLKLAINMNKQGKKIYFSEKSIVRHFERLTFLSYLKKRMDLITSDKTIGYSTISPKPPTNSGVGQIIILGTIFGQLLTDFKFIEIAKLSLFTLVLGSYKFIRKLI